MTEIQGKLILVRVSEGSSYRKSTVFGKAGGTTGRKAGANYVATFFFLGNQDPTTTIWLGSGIKIPSARPAGN